MESQIEISKSKCPSCNQIVPFWTVVSRAGKRLNSPFDCASCSSSIILKGHLHDGYILSKALLGIVGIISLGVLYTLNFWSCLVMAPIVIFLFILLPDLSVCREDAFALKDKDNENTRPSTITHESSLGPRSNVSSARSGLRSSSFYEESIRTNHLVAANNIPSSFSEIREICDERKILSLFHFTPISNLAIAN